MIIQERLHGQGVFLVSDTRSSPLRVLQKNGLSVVEVAQMQKQVLVALNRLKTREAILMKQLNKYRAAVKKVAKQVTKTSSKKARTHRVVVQLQHRLNRFEKQMQLLFDKTVSIVVVVLLLSGVVASCPFSLSLSRPLGFCTLNASLLGGVMSRCPSSHALQ